MEYKDKGFTLLEVLVALAILSLTTVALFQSIGSHLAISERINKSSEAAIYDIITRATLSDIISNTVTVWDVNQASIHGNRSKFTGKTAYGVKEQFVPFKLEIVDHANGKKLVYVTESVEWNVAMVLSENAKFIYLSKRGGMFDEWPQENIKALDGFNNELPLAIYIKDEVKVFTILTPNKFRHLPLVLDFGQ